MTKEVFPGTCKDDRRGERLTEEFGAWHKRRYNAFTLIELVLVVGIITVLAGLVLSTVGYARKKGALARAETEIAAISAACENYKADNGVYPSNDNTNILDARTNENPSSPSYSLTGLYLYNALFGATNGSRTPASGARSYFVFKPNMLFPPDQTQNVQYIQDPFGYSYGYSTAFQHDLDQGLQPTHGYNPTFDLWSTAGGTTTSDIPKWIKNW
jgi:type II secretory pathway pseudopilin PulG